MERDEVTEQLVELVNGPLRLVADELRSMIAIYREQESEAKAGAAAAGTVGKMHSAELRSASAKGAADALQSVVRVLDGTTKKGR